MADKAITPDATSPTGTGQQAHTKALKHGRAHATAAPQPAVPAADGSPQDPTGDPAASPHSFAATLAALRPKPSAGPASIAPQPGPPGPSRPATPTTPANTAPAACAKPLTSDGKAATGPHGRPLADTGPEKDPSQATPPDPAFVPAAATQVTALAGAAPKESATPVATGADQPLPADPAPRTPSPPQQDGMASHPHHPAQAAGAAPAAAQPNPSPAPQPPTLGAHPETAAATADLAALTPQPPANAGDPRTSAADTAAATNHLATAPDLADQVAPVVVRLAAANGASHLSLQLAPEALGRIEISVDHAKDNKITVSLSAQNPQTLELLKKDHALLNQALDRAGLPAEHRTLVFTTEGQPPAAQSGSSQSAPSATPSPAAPDRAVMNMGQHQNTGQHQTMGQHQGQPNPDNTGGQRRPYAVPIAAFAGDLEATDPFSSGIARMPLRGRDAGINITA